MATLHFAVEHLDQPDQLLPAVEQLGIRHAGYGVVADHYPIVGSALVWTLQQVLGPACTPEIIDAWTRSYEMLATTMQRAMARVPATPLAT